MTIEQETMTWEGFGQKDVDALSQEVSAEIEKEPKDLGVLVENVKAKVREKILQKITGRLVNGENIEWEKVLGYAEIGRYSQMVPKPGDPSITKYLQKQSLGYFPREEVLNVAVAYQEVVSRSLKAALERDLLVDLNPSDKEMLDIGLTLNIHWGRIYERMAFSKKNYPTFIREEGEEPTWNNLPGEWHSIPDNDPDKKATEEYIVTKARELEAKGLNDETNYLRALGQVLQAKTDAEYQQAGKVMDQAWLDIMKNSPRVFISTLMERKGAESPGLDRLSVEVFLKDEESDFSKTLTEERARFLAWLEEDEEVKKYVPRKNLSQAKDTPLIPAKKIAMSGRVFEVRFGKAQMLPNGEEFERTSQVCLHFPERFDDISGSGTGLNVTKNDQVSSLIDYELGHSLSHYDELAKSELEFTKAKLYVLASLEQADLELIKKRLFLFYRDVTGPKVITGPQYDFFKVWAEQWLRREGWMNGDEKFNFDQLEDERKTKDFVTQSKTYLIRFLQEFQKMADEPKGENKKALLESFKAEMLSD